MNNSKSDEMKFKNHKKRRSSGCLEDLETLLQILILKYTLLILWPCSSPWSQMLLESEKYGSHKLFVVQEKFLKLSKGTINTDCEIHTEGRISLF